MTGVNIGDFGNGTEVIEGTKPKKEALFVDLVKALDELKGFEIAGENKVFSKAAATIVNNTIVLTASGIAEPLYARYAWRDNSIASLFNTEGLPASSFSTEK